MPFYDWLLIIKKRVYLQQSICLNFLIMKVKISMKLKSVTIIFLAMAILGCRRVDKDATIIGNLINRFPQLKGTSSDRLFGYNLIRSVSIGESNISIKLYSQVESVDDKQKIILVTNSHLLSYAIPLFSNTYRDYWQFQFDKVNQNTLPTNTTFEKQLNLCLDTLQLNDTIGTAGKVVDEIFYSLLHCQDINLCDSSDFLSITMNSNYNIPEENDDSCFNRLKLNWQSISKELFPNETVIINKRSSWDKINSRVYQLDFKNFKRRKKNYFKLNTFRQDCNIYIYTM